MIELQSQREPVAMGETPKPPAQPVAMGETPKPPAQPVAMGETSVQPGPEAAILGRLLVVQQTLDMMPDVDRMASFLRSALGQLPGVREACLCVASGVLPVSANPDVDGSGASEARAPSEGLPETHSILLRRARQIYGVLVLELSDKRAFAPYAPFVTNTANVVASTLEKRQYVARLAALNARLEQQAAELESRIAGRTAELSAKNEELTAEVRERARAEEALRESEAKYRRYIDASPVAVLVLDDRGRCIEVNDAVCALTGYSAGELLGMKALDLVDRESMARAREGAAQLVRNGGLKGEFPLRRRDGRIVDVMLDAARISEGRFIGFCQDITEQKRSEREIRRLWSAVELAPVSILITDRDGNIEYTNPAFSRVTGYTAAEVAGKTPRVLKSLETPKKVYDDLWATITRGQEWRGEFRNIKKSGEPYWEEAVIVPVTDGAGGITNFLAVKEDISARKAAKHALEQMNAELEMRVAERTAELSRAARAKDEFLATMSHELRTPLNAVLGFSEALQEEVYGDVNESQRGALRKIEDSGRHLLALINDILDLSKIESGKMTLDLEVVSAPAICRASVQMVQGLAHAKKQVVELRVHRDLLEIRVDERRLKQILVNLLGNAIKFTPEAGSVGLEVTSDPDGAMVVFTVWDTGIGILREDIPRLFSPFVQLDSSLSRRHTGTGLGLALVRKLSEMHGGSVDVESEPGRGSRFTVRLPRIAARAARSSAPPALLLPAPDAYREN